MIIRLSLQYYPDDIATPENRDFKRMRLREIESAVRILKEMITFVDDKTKDIHLIQPAQFTDAHFLVAEKKRSILKRWTSFVKNGFPENLFTDSVYEHLHLHCGYIAHYDRSGFYVEYWGAHARDFHRHAKKDGFMMRPVPLAFYNWKSFLKQFSIWGEFADINMAMMCVLKEELGLLLKHLIVEAHTHFDAEMATSYELFLIEKAEMREKVDSLRKEADELEERLESLTDDVLRKSLQEHYAGLFGEAFSIVEAASQMSLI
jgi:hypothetical protein